MKRFGKYGKSPSQTQSYLFDMENMEENSEKIWKLQRKASPILKRCGKYGNLESK